MRYYACALCVLWCFEFWFIQIVGLKLISLKNSQRSIIKSSSIANYVRSISLIEWILSFLIERAIHLIFQFAITFNVARAK